MKHLGIPALIIITLGAALLTRAWAHCEIPCGIYGDDRRFEEMREDQRTVSKAIDQITALAGDAGPEARNQLARWVANKESHASRIQHTIAQYFMAQRIKPKDPAYVRKLTSAHAVIIAAMKCKQTVDASTAEALRQSITAFQAAYAG